MTPLKSVPILFLLLLAAGLRSQEFSGGFRAGLNFISFDGTPEMDGDMTLEEFNRTTGFHVGATFAYALTDLVGFKADLMYSQKGGEMVFTGPSFFYLYNDADDTEGLRVAGDVISERDVLNSYIDLPVVAYYKLGPVEFEGGFSAGFLVNSRASGSAEFTNTVLPDGRRIDPVTYNYDYNYFSNEIGFEAIVEESEIRPGYPQVIDAYYNFEDDLPLYRRFDFGLVGGASFFLNNGLYLGVRYQYGLTDTTRGDNDLRLALDPDSEERAYNTGDEDYNRTIQASVGFRF